MPVPLPADVHDLFDRPNFAHVATLMDDGTPQVTPVWVDRDGDVVVFNTALGRTKAENLAQRPEIAVSVLDAEHPYRYVQVRGRAELVMDGAEAHIDKMAKKYLDKDTYPFRKPGERRVIVRVIPEAVQRWGR